uniref:Immunoglobulin V-set domain-containing protein n=1 Tax=Knipowitschia caucasica TaxID=637954 RepID=A0AAV2KQW1_KNICA
MSSNITDVFLRIQEVKLSDSGVYSCRFYIKLDSVLENKMYLNVTSEDRPVGNNTETETRCPTDHVVPVVLGGVTALCIVITVGLSLKILRLQKAAKDQTVDTAEGSLVAARVFMATSLRSRRPNTPEHTHVVYTVIK